MATLPTNKTNVYLEIGKKKALAGAIHWPGWLRAGQDEESALKALYEAAPRYRRILAEPRFNFTLPADMSAFTVVERLEGNATTDFGAPDIAPSSDKQALDEQELTRQREILMACWKAFDEAVASAQGRELRKGPRGGGREIEGIVQHVLDSEASYFRRLGESLPKDEANDRTEDLERRRQFILETLASKAHIETPGQGPRGGKQWMPRYFVRRAAYHLVDHIWEIEDRLIE